MKFSLFSRIMFATLVLAFTTSVFAANDSHKSNFEISAATQVNGTTLPAGRLHSQMGRLRPTVQVSIMQGKKVVATASAEVVALDRKPASRRRKYRITPMATANSRLCNLRGRISLNWEQNQQGPMQDSSTN